MVAVCVPFRAVIHTEIENSNQPDRLELIVPIEGLVIAVFLNIFSLCYGPLIQYRVGEVVQSPVLEELLPSKLHLNNVLVTCCSPYADIEDGLAVFLCGPEMLDILEADIFNVTVTHNVVEKCDKNVFSLLASE